MIRTDLALEVRESINEEAEGMKGVSLEENIQENVKITKVVIKDKLASDAMKKPIGTYITIEDENIIYKYSETRKIVIEQLKQGIMSLLPDKEHNNKNENKETVIMLAGLGNRNATPDSLGPKVAERLLVTRNSGEKSRYKLCSIAPGVMGQTGMESIEIIRGLISEIKPDCLIIIDALAARNINRLNTTIQLTDTGICPGSGVGNNRKEINSNKLGIKVISVGVPTVVDAGTIIRDSMTTSLKTQEFTDYEIDTFITGLSIDTMQNFYVTPKDIDEAINNISELVAEAINHCFSK